VALAEQLFGEVWSEGKVDLLDEIIGEGYVKHWASTGSTMGKDALKSTIVAWRASVPDHKEALVDIEASGDMVFARWIETGTFVKDFEGIPATGKKFRVAAMGWIRFNNGKIVEEWTIVDNWGYQSQLGVKFPVEWLSPGWD
jgi:steroid delta-isomerase-like uncharacterized protein